MPILAELEDIGRKVRVISFLKTVYSIYGWVKNLLVVCAKQRSDNIIIEWSKIFLQGMKAISKNSFKEYGLFKDFK